MKNKSFVWFFSLAAILATGLLVISCNKKFDEPPTFLEPNITANTTISALKALHTFGAFEPITSDKIIEGIVVADDKSGNFYKSIVIQDATGGITVRLDGTSLFTTYPIGRKIYIKLNGLYLGDYNGLVQIGGGVDNTDPARPALAPLASNLFDTYIAKGSVGNPVVPKVVKLSDLTTNMLDPLQSTLIQLDNFEFLPADTNKVYAPPQTTVNFTIRNCDGKSIVVRNSGYANFAGFNLPNGNGSIVAVYSIFGSTPQLFIRDTADVKFNGVRCNGGSGNGAVVTVDSLRKLYTGTGLKLGSYKISGTVISDAASKNVSGGTAILQNGNKGIAVYWGGTLTYNIGDSLVLDVTGDSLISYAGALELKRQSGADKPAPVATGKFVTPQVMTAAQLSAALNAPLASSIENTLVKIVGAAATPTGTFAGAKTLTDASGSIILYTASAATFAGATMPAGAADWTGIATVFPSGNELKLRNANDVTGGTNTGGNALIDQNFEGVTANADISIAGWQNLAETGGVKYQGKLFSNNKYAQVSAFSSGQATVTSWLVTPAFNLDNTTGELLTFKSKDGFNNGATLKVMISTNYDGGVTPWTATWTDLTATISSGTATGYAASWVNSGDISLNSFAGANVYIAFKYVGGDPGSTTTYQIDDVKVTGN